MMKKLGIIGYGVFGKQIENLLYEAEGRTALDVYYFDDESYGRGEANSFPFTAYLNDQFRSLHFYIGLGYKHLLLREEICNQLLQNGLELSSFVHRTSYVNPSANIGRGVIVYPMCNIDQETELCNGVILNNSVTVSHNSRVGSCTFIAPGAVIAGNVDIGKHCFIGTGSVVSNNVTISCNVKVGIGSAVTKDIDANLCVIGNPLKILEKPFSLI